MHAGLLAPIYVSSAAAAYKSVVILNGILRQIPASAPLGQALQLTSGALVPYTSGKPIIWDPVIAYLREAGSGETVELP